jgi:hypothetical protein
MWRRCVSCLYWIPLRRAASIDGDEMVHSTASLSRLRSTKPHISPSWPRKQTAPDRIAAPKVLV